MVINIEDLPPEIQERVRQQEAVQARVGQSKTERVKEAVHKIAERAKAIAKSERAKAIAKRGGKVVRYLAGAKEGKGKRGKGRKGKAIRGKAARPRGVYIQTGDIQTSAMQSGSPMHGGKMNEEAFDIMKSSNLNVGFGGIDTKKGIGLGKSSLGLGKSNLGLGKWKL